MADMPACIDLLWGQSMVGASPWLCLMAQTSSHDSLLCIWEAWGFRQLSVLSGCLAESSCGCTIHVLLRVKCISQSVSQSAGSCSTVNQGAENKSSSLTQRRGLYWREHKDELLLAVCYRVCVCECFCFLWMNCKCLQHTQPCLTRPPPHL